MGSDHLGIITHRWILVSAYLMTHDHSEKTSAKCHIALRQTPIENTPAPGLNANYNLRIVNELCGNRVVGSKPLGSHLD